MQATTLLFGVVNAPGQRYHPALIAQAIGTLSSMYPGRFWAALGTGEASNEHITATGWPRKQVRNDRLRECVEIIRALLVWRGGEPRWAGQRRPSAGMDTAVRPTATARRGCWHRDSPLVCSLGRRAHHRQRRSGAAVLHDRCVPGGLAAGAGCTCRFPSAGRPRRYRSRP